MRIAGAFVALALLLGPSGAGAEGATIPVNVLVTYLSSEGTGVDPSARRLDEKLRKQFRYDSLQVLEKRRIDLEMDGVGTIDLPNGRAARLSPIHEDEAGVLMAVEAMRANGEDV